MSSTVLNRTVITIVVAIVVLIGLMAYDMVSGPVEAGIAAKQVEDSAVTYALANEAIKGSLIKTVLTAIGLGLIIVTWLLPAAKIDAIATAAKDLFKK